MRRHWAYFKYVFWHKVRVFQAGRALGLPFWRLLMHDISKFYPDEWFAYAETFYNHDGSKKDYAESPAFLKAWALHQKRNPHHWQYYLNIAVPHKLSLNRLPHLLVMDRGAFLTIDGQEVTVGDTPSRGLIPDEMPLIYVREMLADWISFAPDDRQKQRDWWFASRDQKILHPETRKMLEGWFERV